MKTYEVIEHFLAKKESKLTQEEILLIKEHFWLKALWFKDNADDINIENFDQIDRINPHATLEYVCRSLKIFES